MPLMKISNFLLIFIITLFFTACGSYKNANMYKKNPKIQKDEKILLAKTEKLDNKLNEHENTMQKDEYNAYPNEILKKLLKDDPLIANENINFEIKVIKDPSMNAFALPNGKIYIHTGILSTIENEAQLALLIGHEMSHIIHKHSLKQSENQKSVGAFAQILGTFSAPFDGGIVGLLVYTSSIYGYSQEHENEADKFGYEQIVNAGYDPIEASKLFDLMLKNIELNDIKEPYFFSTHPKVKDRIKSSKNLIEKNYENKTGLVNKEKYENYSKNILNEDIELNLKLRKYKVAKSLIEKLKNRENSKNDSIYFEAELQRLNKEKIAFKEIIKKYEEVLNADETYAKAHRGIAFLYLQNNEKEKAKTAFERYLALNENASDKQYINYYIEQCKKGKND